MRIANLHSLSRRTKPRPAPWLRLIAILWLAAGGLFGCNRGAGDDAAHPAFPPVAVLVAKAIQKSVPERLQAIGTVEAFAIVGIKARVEGQLVAIHFKEGDYVTRGQLLFTLDRRPFQAALDSARANFIRDQATAHQASVDEQRYRTLWEQGVGSRQQFDQSHATAASSAGTLASDRALVESAQLNLEFTQITAPVAGRTGSLQSHLGDLIKEDADTPIVTIAQIEPLYVTFSIPEKDLSEVRRNMEIRQLAVTAMLPGDQAPSETGVLAFVDNTVDKTTGTIILKGLFPNHDRRLWPGQFVNVGLTLNEIPNAILVPTQALQTGQEGQFVFVVGADMKVTPRPVVLGPVIGGETVIERGLEAGATVVTDGQLRLMPGATVRIKDSLAGGTSS
ncbi:MAG TPA: efflux RND transporter periplasmic adaptor subunit [Candidatus Binataceae bacterium]|nr:efflux RND transporter periplasmic adaptor subunit [Candidatus Binataceae bacterium]